MCSAAYKNLERETGIEPATNSLEGCDSTIELLPPGFLRFVVIIAASRLLSTRSHLIYHFEARCADASATAGFNLKDQNLTGLSAACHTAFCHEYTSSY